MLITLIYVFIITLIAIYLGKYIGFIYSEEFNKKNIHKKILKFIGFDNVYEQTNYEYFKSLILFNLIGLTLTFTILIFQDKLPMNYSNLQAVPLDLAFNIAVSFITGSNWQPYNPEFILSDFSQIFCLITQNFLSAATCFSLVIILMRSIINTGNLVGNFYHDSIKSIFYILLPLAFLSSVILIWQNVPQNFSHNIIATNLDDVKQVIPLGPMAAQTSISLLSNSGLGLFNTNFSHPFQNPSSLTNLFELLLMLILPASLIFTYSYYTKNYKHSYNIYMICILALLSFVLINNLLDREIFLNIGEYVFNLEGKELRNNIVESALWNIVSNMTNTGAINTEITSYYPANNIMNLLIMIMKGITFGQVGIGLCIIILYVMLTIFIMGYIQKKDPVYFSKKINVRIIKYILITLLAAPILSSITNLIYIIYNYNSLNYSLTEILYMNISSIVNNGSMIKTFDNNSLYFNISSTINMLLGRFIPIFFIFKISQELHGSTIIENNYSINTESFKFNILYILIVFIISILPFLPFLMFGSIEENSKLISKQSLMIGTK